MTHPPFDRSTADPGTPSPGWGTGDATAVSWRPVPAAPRRSRRGIVVAALVAGLLVLGGSGFAFASYLAGGGTQPEDVLPADTLGFVRLDLDTGCSSMLPERSASASR